MRTLASVNDKTPAIYCLSVMKIIVDEFNAASQITPVDVWGDLDGSNGSQPNTQERWSPDTLANFFKGSRGQRALSLVVLQVIWACTSGMEKSQPEHSLASGIMANDILAAVPYNDRQEWWASSRNIQVVRKLHSRCLVPDMSPALRFQALTFLTSFTEAISPPQQYTVAYEQLVLEFGTNSSAAEQLDYALQLSLPRFAPSFEGQWWETFVGELLEILVEPKASTLVQSTASWTCLLHRFADVMEESSQCRQGLISALSSFRYRQKLDRFLYGPNLVPSSTEGYSYCTKAIATNMNSLASSFCSLLLRSALSSRANEVQLPGNLIPGILKKHAAFDSTDPKCVSCEQRPKIMHREALFVEVESTPDAELAHLPWKERLARKMQAQASEQQQAVIESFTNICRELEERCENVETPLRQEQEKLIALQTRHGQLGKAYSELESHAMDRDLRINTLESEHDSNLAELEATGAEVQSLLQRVEDAAKELRKSNDDARYALAAAQQEKHELELEHATTLACKQQTMDETREELQRSRNELQELQSQLIRLEEGDKQSNVRYEQLQSGTRELQGLLREKEEKLLRTDEERRSLSEMHGTLQREFEKSCEERSNFQRQNESLATQLEDLKTYSKQEIDRATASFEDAMARNRQEVSHLLFLFLAHLLTGKVVGNEDELGAATRRGTSGACSSRRWSPRAARAGQTESIRTTEKGVLYSHLHDLLHTNTFQIDRLTKECHKKDAQVVEAQEMRNRLMNAMGLATVLPPAMPVAAPEPSAKPSALPYRSASTMATPKQSSQPLASTPARAAQELEMDDADEGNNSDASNAFSDHGPTPKRARPRQSFRRGSVNQRHSVGSRSVKSALRTKGDTQRRPLLDLDTNRSPSKRGRSPSKVTFMGVEKEGLGISTAERRDMEDWSFSNADILTGTPGFGLRDQTDYLDEDSTVDL